MDYSLKELIKQIEPPASLKQYKKNTPLYIKEALNCRNWYDWDEDVFYDYFEKAHNCVAYLGQGVFRQHHKQRIKNNWMRLAPHLKAIALSQDVPLWDEYKAIRMIIKECTEDNMQIATNRMIACLQPKLLCTEVDLKKINELFDLIQTYTDTTIPQYDRENWEKASHALLRMMHKLEPERDYMNFAYIPWKLLEFFKASLSKGSLPTYWLTSWNENDFMLHKFFYKHETIDWNNKRNNQFHVGDIVYLYSSSPERKIRYKTQVIKLNIAPEEEIDDHDYSLSTSPSEPSQHRPFRLKKIGEIDTESLNYENLHARGLNGSIRTPRAVTGFLQQYIDTFFENEQDNSFPPADAAKGLNTYWLISSNDSIFRLADCLSENRRVDWQGSFSPKVGDLVFIYRTKPSQRISYVMKVIELNIPYRRTINDIKYWGTKHSPKEATNPEEPYHRLELLEETSSNDLCLKKLQEHGMLGVPQGPRKLSGELLDYILSVFEMKRHDYDEKESAEGYFEGALKKVYVNRYERDQEARKKCIEVHGCKCSVCGIDFEKMYGELGRGFIHVHHIVPISTIGEEYKIDPIKDLVPVCPNCHSMLHRGKDGEVLTIDELKDRIETNNKKH